MKETYTTPVDGWVCFHCGERFLTYKTALEHFGERPWVMPACCLSRKELREYRRLEMKFSVLDERNTTLYEKFLQRRLESS